MATVHVQTFFILKFLPSHRNNNLSAGVQSTLFSNAFVVIFMMMCHKFFWLCRPGTDMMTCAGKQTCLAAHSVGMPVSGSGYTWYDLAFGPCQCPLAWIPAVPSQPSLAGNKMYWDRGRGNHHCGMAWLSAMLKDRLLAGPAWGCIVHQSTPHQSLSLISISHSLLTDYFVHLRQGGFDKADNAHSDSLILPQLI